MRDSPPPLTVARGSPQCLVEAVLVLDMLCRQEPSFLYRALSGLKALHARLCADPACVRVLLPIAQFFLNHGEPGDRARRRGCPARGDTPPSGPGRPRSPRAPSLHWRAAFLTDS